MAFGHWGTIRQQAKKRASGRCEECGVPTTEFHVHHLTYERFGKELLTDVRAICLPCHGLHHPHHTFRPIWEQRVIAAGKNPSLIRFLKRRARLRNKDTKARYEGRLWNNAGARRMAECPGDIRATLIASYTHD